MEESVAIPPAEQYVNQSSPIALVGQTHKLHCLFSGYPEPTPTWYKDGLEISQDNTDGFFFEAYGKTLSFNVTLEKAGKYDCKFPSHNDIDRSFQVVVDGNIYSKFKLLNDFPLFSGSVLARWSANGISFVALY